MDHIMTFADRQRVQQVAMLCGAPRPFQNHEIIQADESWAWISLGEFVYAIPLSRLKSDLACGPIFERLFWLIMVSLREQGSLELRLSNDELKQRIWGNRVPWNWGSILRRSLRSLSDLRIGHWPHEEECDPIQASEALCNSIVQLKSRKEFVFDIAPGFLGCLSEFVEGNGDYSVHDRRLLRELRRQNRLTEVFLPIYLGDRDVCGQFSPRQKLLLQMLLREKTVASRKESGTGSDANKIGPRRVELVSESQIQDFNGQDWIDCPELEKTLEYVGFNGNRLRRGLGYRVSTWQRRACYRANETKEFIEDLEVLCTTLGVVAGTVDRNNQWHDLASLKRLLLLPRYLRAVEMSHLRIYVEKEYDQRWAEGFQWNLVREWESPTAEKTTLTNVNPLDSIKIRMRTMNIRQKEIARELGVSKSYVSKALKEPYGSDRLKRRIDILLSSYEEAGLKEDVAEVVWPELELATPSSASLLKQALDYHARGLSVIPIKPGTKASHVRWTKYKEVRPTESQVRQWWTQWPDAGIAVVLGPVSDLLCVDVDGKKAHEILVELLDEFPLAPMVKSGNADPNRYHLYFKHPHGLLPFASKTPWNSHGDREKLEIRGQGGYMILPPSRHPSGRPYCWVQGRTLDVLALPELPQKILLELRKQEPVSSLKPDKRSTDKSRISRVRITVSKSTAAFLRGEFANSPGWNNRMFKAACDLNGRDVEMERATRMILRGAQPDTERDQQMALATIRSAYAQKRDPARY